MYLDYFTGPAYLIQRQPAYFSLQQFYSLASQVSVGSGPGIQAPDTAFYNLSGLMPINQAIFFPQLGGVTDPLLSLGPGRYLTLFHSG
jgi:hypothetical protein